MGEVAGPSAHELASRLYTATFRGAVVNSTLAVLGASRQHFGAGAISVQPAEFVRLVPTTTATHSSTTVTTKSSMATVTSTTSMTTSTLDEGEVDVISSTTSLATSFAWLWLVTSGLG